VWLVEEPPVGDTTAEWRAESRFGPYLLKQLLGRGGFGEVYEAVDTNKNRIVALKLLPPSISANPVFRQRLFREASTAGRLHEPHVVPIHDFGEIDGQLYIDMRLVRGSDLQTVLAESGLMDPARAVSIVGQIAAALDAAHAEQIVHRDVKPANILLTAEDFAYLVDFGLANAATDAKITTAGATIGTFAYMAPERFADEQVGPRADVYALACVLYECLTGASPYQVSQPSALIAAHLTAPTPRPSQQRPELPAGFDEVIARGMAKSPDDRYASAGELAAAADEVLAADKGGSTFTAPQHNSRRRNVALLAAATVLLLSGITAITLHLTNRHDKSAAALANPAPPGPVIATVAATIRVGSRPQGVAIDPRAHTAYTANHGDDTMSVIDTTTHTVTGTIKVGKGPVWVAVDPSTHTAYTTNNRDDTVSVIDLSTNTITATVGVGINPWGIAVDATTHTAYVANMWDNNVSVINLADYTTTATIPVGKNPFCVAVDPNSHTVYTTNFGDGTVSVIDTAARTVTATIKVGHGPRGIAVDPTADTLYTANYGDGTVSAIDTTARTVTATIKVGNDPQDVAVDSSTHTAYATNSRDSTMSAIDTARHAVTTINLGNHAVWVTIDPATHTAYTANSPDNTVSVIEARK
jgi:serine/threonine protein kinase, bacterial